ncbi:MAG: NHLP family bacteriocin export ABC transporter peptidase/permease/ATPase subunit [Acidaminococcaceae bacterium]|jgi:NHLM bacteriocin system ABC transporter peptidase/ATP-binding protein|nr:NHLP family bacteriocin export ABC transporter peptidase/permease/ATPase subunit [Acidaminococcaceae bacterium]MBQ6743224.1 NHLP family bacteriocin export ABC transporter peptidase/permease/ATPase subunit [Acidaminococcaceae bacterium]MBQ6778854.1 NHLP family bacteriocin export ABC transporter peptidase/permease/ATPase subunit [Acidaminococcaceae bacterium]MBR4526314.1 NHLP family bacteriocin export ABC transporter peptidase/permease/ATPase subunit [Acidaminococcaceae bacterium]MBR6818318.1 
MDKRERIRQFFAGKERVKVPTVLQMEATECGAASLAMILAYYGRWLPLEFLRQECGVTRDGSNADNLLKAARRQGCVAKAFAGRSEVLRKKEFPLILFWEFNHFLVLEGFQGDTVFLNDPAMGRRTVPWDEFITSYTGVYMKITPDENFKPEGEPYSIVKTVAAKLREDKWALIFLMVLGLCMIIPGLAVPVMSQIFIDDVFSLKHADWIVKLLIAMFGTMVMLGIMTAMRAAVLTYWQKKLTIADSSGFFWHVLRMPVTFFQQRYAADIASRIQFNESTAEVLSNQAATALLDLLVALFYLLLLFQYSVPLTLIGISISVVDIFVFLYMRRRQTDLIMRIQQDASKAYGVLMSGLMMVESIKANGSEGDLFAKWAGYAAKASVATQEMKLWTMKVKLLPLLLGGLNSALIMTVGGFSIMEGIMTAGIYTAFNNLIAKFHEPVQKLLSLGNVLQNTEMQMRRLDDVRRYKTDSLNYPDENQTVSFTGNRLSGELTLKDVSFGYSPLDPPLIEHFDLHLEPGRWAAVVGSSGSGKSTLAKLVAGLYEEWSGEILFDGVKRREIPRPVIVNSLATVDQDVFQISGTVRQNISMFDKSVPSTDIVQAAQDACIHDDIIQLQGGYDAEVSEGGLNFSGGQRQRLEIARALAFNPSLLILDEATSAIDPMTEQKCLENIRRRGCTCLIVAHRLSTIREADEIIVLERGKVAERGTHRELISHDGPYRRLIEERDQQEADAADLD